MTIAYSVGIFLDASNGENSEFVFCTKTLLDTTDSSFSRPDYKNCDVLETRK